MSYAQALKKDKVVCTAKLEENFYQMKSILESIANVCSWNFYSTTIKTDKCGLIYWDWDYNLHTAKWNISLNHIMKIEGIAHNDLIEDFFVGSKFEKYFLELNSVKGGFIEEEFTKILLCLSITITEKKEDSLIICYKQQYNFNIEFLQDTGKFQIRYTPFDVISNGINKLDNIEAMLQRLIIAYYAMEYGY